MNSERSKLKTQNHSKNLLLDVKKLKTYFFLDEGILKALDGVSFSIENGKTLGLVGESGCGKSIAAKSIMRIVPAPSKTEGKIVYYNHEKTGYRITKTDKENENVSSDFIKNMSQINQLDSNSLFEEESKGLNLLALNKSGREMRSIRGKDITMIFQEPMSSFSPLHTIGNQIMEAILTHQTTNKSEAREVTLEMLNKVGLSNPSQRIHEYPHQFSGGMLQRAMIAMALSCRPSLLIADEPTTALDVTVQAQVMELMIELRDELGMAMLYITHDLGVIAEMADQIAVMYLGKIVECGSTNEIFNNPQHPYTKALLNSIPKLGEKSDKPLDSIKGTVPVPIEMPDRCRFLTRCKYAMQICLGKEPVMKDTGEGHHVRCYIYDREKEVN